MTKRPRRNHAPAFKAKVAIAAIVFPAKNGEWIAPQNWLRRGFYVACIEARLVTETEEDGDTVVRPKYRPYDLRYFYASMLIEQRVSMKRVQYLMGHEDVTTTLNVYGHLIERAEVKPERTRGLLASMAQSKRSQVRILSPRPFSDQSLARRLWKEMALGGRFLDKYPLR